MANLQKLARTTAILACAAAGLTATALLASPGSGLTSTVFVTATNQYDALINHDRVKFRQRTRPSSACRNSSLQPAATAVGIIIPEQ